MTLTQMSPLQQRIIVSSIGTFIVLMTIYLSSIPLLKPLFSLSIALMICLALNELYQIAYAKQFMPVKSLGMGITLCYTSAVTVSMQYPFMWAKILPEITLLSSFFICFLYYFANGVSPLKNLSLMIFSLAYLVIPLSCMISIVYFFADGTQDGRFWLLYTITVAKMTDMGGYFFGKQFGKQLLAPYISPKKTVEGAIGGVLIAIISGWVILLLATILNVSFALTLWQSIWLGALIAVVAQCGDLAESLLKRDGGIKDSSHLPGLGGILDIVDSLIFATPLVYIFIKINFMYN